MSPFRLLLLLHPRCLTGLSAHPTQQLAGNTFYRSPYHSFTCLRTLGTFTSSSGLHRMTNDSSLSRHLGADALLTSTPGLI
uniref:EC53 protein n=1 Tax=Colletotrichum higginsianum TaxID=80884 RepID=I2G7D3_9PEZI|nr:EC53 protein [Colletotrichum higginsianum]